MSISAADYQIIESQLAKSARYSDMLTFTFARRVHTWGEKLDRRGFLQTAGYQFTAGETIDAKSVSLGHNDVVTVILRDGWTLKLVADDLVEGVK